MSNLLTHIFAISASYQLPDQWLAERPHLFSSAIITLTPPQINAIENTITAIEEVIALPTYRETVLAHAPNSAQQNFGSRGVLFGYDFHLNQEGAKLIEINTNAGGAFLAALLEAAQHNQLDILAKWEEQFLQMFLYEWKIVCGDQALQQVAIVDDHPQEQFLYPEFLLFQSLLKRHGIATIIADPSEFSIKDNRLCVGDLTIDFVYNRLTDFYLTAKEHQVLQQAYLQNLAVFSPNPHVYALYSDKRNLEILSDEISLRNLDVNEKIIGILLKTIPQTHRVTGLNAADLWDQRKKLFFKPIQGYGSKGTYRGDKVTRRVFDEIIHADYVAQTIVPPSTYTMEGQDYKVDLRVYVYGSVKLGMVARLYQGQTTNFRTAGGGFAVVEHVM